MSAVQERQRRSTAGKRMNFLTGQAAEQDDAFWGHDTWGDDDDGSFHSSDEDSAVKQDEFDSDFDKSESDHEDEEEAAGANEERNIRFEERETGKRKGYVDKSSAAAAASKRGRWGPLKGKRIMGDGLNAGIVLNIPRPGAAAAVATGVLGIGSAQLPMVVHPPPQPPPPSATAAVTLKPPPRKKIAGPTLAASRSRRNAREASGYSSQSRQQTDTKTANAKSSSAAATSSAASSSKAAAAAATAAAVTRKKPKQRFTQEQLLLEGVVETEPENQRWLLGRKRNQAEKEQAATPRGEQKSGNVIEKLVSRRGYLNTITFSSMDHVPEILRSSTAELKPPPKLLCVITGKPAKYKDPQTGKGYFNLAAFKEIRRRQTLKEPVDQRKKKRAGKPASAANKPAPTVVLNGKPGKLSVGQPPPEAISSAVSVRKPSANGKPAAVASAHGKPATKQASNNSCSVAIVTNRNKPATAKPLNGKANLPAGVGTSVAEAGAVQRLIAEKNVVSKVKPSSAVQEVTTYTVPTKLAAASSITAHGTAPDASVALKPASVAAGNPTTAATAQSATPAPATPDPVGNGSVAASATASNRSTPDSRRSSRRRTPSAKMKSSSMAPSIPEPPKTGEAPQPDDTPPKLAPSLGHT